MSAAADLISDPHWFPTKLDMQSRALHFTMTDRASLAAAPFLDDRFTSAGAQTASLSLDQVLSATPPTTPPPHWIFHTAFCCSTLMARAMDVPDHSFALKEPGILMDLANARRMAAQNGLSDSQLSKLTDMIFALLARRFAPSEAVIIKPTNPANSLISETLARGHKAIFMVSELRDFLISVLKKGESCKAFMRTLYNIFALDPAPLGAIPQRQALTFTDLQITSLVQRHQMELMTALCAQHSALTRAFDGNKLPLAPARYLNAAAAHFGLSWPDDTADTQAASDVFARNSKFEDQSYGADARAEDAAAIEAAHSEALQITLQWAAQLTLGGAVSMPPAKVLA